MIQLDRVQRRFGSRVLFEELNWTIPNGAQLGLVGSNGTGKTTLLRMLSGRELPDEGLVHKPRGLEVGYLPQEVESVEAGSVLSVVLAGFAEISRIEAELQQVESRLAACKPGDPQAEPLTEAYGRLRHSFEQLDGDRLEARAKVILSGLGIPTERFHEPLDRLSGGWRMRVVLARLLLGAPGLLLLDEPTNHLDLEAIAWLEEFLQTYEGAFVVVSHDRYFLNRMVRGIVELERGRLTHYAGNYDGYVDEREQRELRLEQSARQQAREIARTERFIERFRYKNTKSKQVQSRIKSLSKVERIQTAKQSRRIGFGFPPAPRSGDIVVRAEAVDKSYGSLRVYDGMNLLLRRGDRVALVGPNGAGKSTLLKLLAGTVTPDAGEIGLGHNVTLQYYAQHQLEALQPRNTVLEEVELVGEPGERQRLRTLLGRFLFTGDDVDKPVGVLSGGEKARLALAKLLIRPANLLLLDEPTNHLDLASREILEAALNEYEGTIVVISHDRYFINRVITAVAEVGDGKIEIYAGDYDEYLDWKSRRAAEDPGTDATQPAAGSAREARQAARREAAEERNRRYREEQSARARLEPLEREIAELEQLVTELERQQADPEIYSDADRARQTGRDRAEATARLEKLYKEWETLADQTR